MSNGFIQTPRSLLEILSEYPTAQRWVMITIIEHACYQMKEGDDHGQKIKLEPGQLMCTIRQLAEWAKVKKNDVERGVKRFLKDEIVRQEVRHCKTIITITHKETRERFLGIENNKVRQEVRKERDKSETQTKKERKKEDKEAATESKEAVASVAAADFMKLEKLGVPKGEIQGVEIQFRKKKLTQEDFDYGIKYLSSKPLQKNPAGSFFFGAEKRPEFTSAPDPEKNKTLALEMEKIWESKFYKLLVLNKGIEFAPFSSQAPSIVVPFESVDFKQKLNVYMKKLKEIDNQEVYA
jgi:DNA-binding transcriptional regulator YhcF (GntR family)